MSERSFRIERLHRVISFLLISLSVIFLVVATSDFVPYLSSLLKTDVQILSDCGIDVSDIDVLNIQPRRGTKGGNCFIEYKSEQQDHLFAGSVSSLIGVTPLILYFGGIRLFNYLFPKKE